jgi:hypothetical protein
VPASASATFEKNDSIGMPKPVNPITGQFLDMQKFADAPEMTEEEKEREAERLFVLFERLVRYFVSEMCHGRPGLTIS